MPRQDPGEPYFRVDSAEARKILDGDPENTVVVDVRRDDEWVTGHATGQFTFPSTTLRTALQRCRRTRSCSSSAPLVFAADSHASLLRPLATTPGICSTWRTELRPGSPSAIRPPTETIPRFSERDNLRDTINLAVDPSESTSRSYFWLLNRQMETSGTFR